MKPARLLLLVALAALPSVSASAIDVSAFLAVAEPGQNWAGGAGGALGIGLFKILHFEAEYAHLPGEFAERSHNSLIGSAVVAPSIGRFVPYAGLGVGGYWQKDNGHDNTGFQHDFVAGLKLKLGLVFVKGEYRKITLPDDVLLDLDHRFSVGAGLSF